MNFSDMTFIRKFSLNLYKSLNVPLSKMTLTSDFTDTVRGDLYPLITKDEGTVETVAGARYSVCGGSAERMVAAFFPYATYKLTIDDVVGSAGFAFVAGQVRCTVLLENDSWSTSIAVTHADGVERVRISREIDDGVALLVSARPGFFELYTESEGRITFIKSVEVPSFKRSNADSFYRTAKVHTLLCGNVTVSGMESYIDCGIGQADVRPFRYENGDVIMENGRVFITFSARMQAGGYQGILSWVPGTCDFRMVGAIFYSVGTGVTHGDVATAYVFDRRDGNWYMWQRSGGAGHVLAKATFKDDIRYGVNVLDVEALPIMTAENMDDTKVLGKKGDEDPDFMYDETRGKWLFAICRLAEETKKYQYFFFESDHPHEGYEYVGRGPAGDETGGSIVKLDGKVYFVCGNDFHKTSDYRVYEWGKFDTYTNLKTDYPDGGFRGWGTVMPIRYGTRYRYFWLTFDRMLMSKTFNWSYGNLYCFEADGTFPIK